MGAWVGVRGATLRPVRRCLPILKLSLAGCGPGLADTVPLLGLPDRVTYDVLPDVPTPVGVPVENIGTDTAFIRASATGDAVLDEVRFRLEPKDRTELVVLLTADGYDGVDGEVHFLLRDTLTVVPVVGRVANDIDGDGYDAVEVGGTDCDDQDPDRSPGTAELCNDIDDDCDTLVDEELPLVTFWLDQDDDGYGDPEADTEAACRAPDGYVDNGEDCDDDDADVSPAATERWYDGFDDNCDGHSDFDQDFDGVDALGYGGTDCDDESDAVYPGAPELDDLVDNDCDSFRDEDIIHPGDLVFTELFVEPQTGTPGQAEWLEIHNTSSTHVDVSLVRLVVGAEAIDLSDVVQAIPPNAPWLVCASLDPLVNGGIDGCDAQLPDFPPGARTFTMESPVEVVDAVDATGWSVTQGRSLELASDQVDATANDDEASWCTAVSLFGDLSGDRGTPGVLLPPCP